MLQFGMRLCSYPRVIATTTPRPTARPAAPIKLLLADPDVRHTLMTTSENDKSRGEVPQGGEPAIRGNALRAAGAERRDD
jgi:phage terminase large subunit-like protein